MSASVLLELLFTHYWMQIIAALILFIFFIWQLKLQNGEKQVISYTICPNPSCFRCSQKNLLNKISKQYENYCAKNILTNKRTIKVQLDNYIKQIQCDSGIGNTPTLTLIQGGKSIIDTDEHKLKNDVNELEMNWNEILSEYKCVSNDISEASGWKINETPSGNWCVFYLINQGIPVRIYS